MSKDSKALDKTQEKIRHLSKDNNRLTAQVTRLKAKIKDLEYRLRALSNMV